MGLSRYLVKVVAVHARPMPLHVLACAQRTPDHHVLIRQPNQQRLHELGIPDMPASILHFVVRSPKVLVYVLTPFARLRNPLLRYWRLLTGLLKLEC
jgi:hypothetical protein